MAISLMSLAEKALSSREDMAMRKSSWSMSDVQSRSLGYMSSSLSAAFTKRSAALPMSTLRRCTAAAVTLAMLDEAAAALEAEEAAAAALRRRAPAVEVEREDGAHVEALVDVLALSHRVRGV